MYKKYAIVRFVSLKSVNLSEERSERNFWQASKFRKHFTLLSIINAKQSRKNKYKKEN